MKIATRLVGLSVASALALSGIGLLGVAGIRSLQTHLNEMNSSVVPLQRALFEKQLLNEQVFGAIQELVQASTTQQITEARHSIDQTLADIDRVIKRIEDIDSLDRADGNALQDEYATIAKAVDSRQASVTAAVAETHNARELLDHVDELVRDVSQRVDLFTNGAVAAAYKAQTRLDRLIDALSDPDGPDRDRIDRINVEIDLQRKTMTVALALVADPRSIRTLNRELLVGAQQVRAQLIQMMLATEPASLDLALNRARELFSAMMHDASVLQVALASLGSSTVKFNAYDLNKTFNSTRQSIDQLNSSIGARIRSDEALRGHLQALAANFLAQRLDRQQRLDEVTRQFDDHVAVVDGEVHRATVLIVLIGLLAVLGSALISAVTIRTISRRLQHANAVAQSVSRGVLVMAAPGREQDELSGLFETLFGMVTTLDTSVRQIRDASHAVNHGARNISSGSGALSDRSDQQADRLSDTAASTRCITGLVHQGASAIEEVSNLSLTASASVARGHEVAQEAISKMHRIETGAHQIDSIISVIDDIAIQTNILALNAAVEAARAGVVGRGFAVVAQEVRDLARKSKESASQIKQIVKLNVHEVEAGTALVRDAGHHLEQALSEVDEVAKLVDAVASATRSQVTSITTIDTSLVNLKSTTQENALLSEQTSQAANDLVYQAKRLEQAVSVFQLADESAPPVAAAHQA